MSNLTRPSEFFGPDCWTYRPSFRTKPLSCEIDCDFVRELLLANALGHRPGRLGDQLEDRRLKLRRRLVALAVDDLAVVDMLSVPPIIEERRRRVDVDPGPGRVTRKPAQPLHGDRELPRAIGGAGAERADRVAAENAVGLDPEIATETASRPPPAQACRCSGRLRQPVACPRLAAAPDRRPGVPAGRSTPQRSPGSASRAPGLIGLPSGSAADRLGPPAWRSARSAWLSALYSSVCGGERVRAIRRHCLSGAPAADPARRRRSARDRVDFEKLFRVGIAVGECRSIFQRRLRQGRAIFAALQEQVRLAGRCAVPARSRRGVASRPADSRRKSRSRVGAEHWRSALR